MTIASAAINPGGSNQFQVNLYDGPIAPCAGDDIPVAFEVIDPEGVRHEYHEITISDPICAPGAAGCSNMTDYLTRFDNIPNTDISGRYYVIARIPDANTGEEFDQVSFMVNLPPCEEAFYDITLMAENQVTLESIPEMKPSDIVECCDFPCCLELVLDTDCVRDPVASTFPAAEIVTGTTEPGSFGYMSMCEKILPTVEIQYTSINASKYVVVGQAVEDSSTTYYIVDIQDDACILADITTCWLTTKRLLIDEDVYRAYIINEWAHQNPICAGFYTPEMPWPYEIQTPRYLAIYGDLTDFLYCRLAPTLVSESKWCHFINFDWYSVVDLVSELDVTFITPEAIEAEKEWNNLSGYIILGHACPLTMDTSDLEVCGPRKPIIKTPNDGSTFSIAYSIRFEAILSQPYGSVDCLPPPAGTFPGPPYTFKWDFGDGGFAFGENVNHAYNLEGIYTVTLYVSYPGIPGETENSIVLEIIDPSPLPGVLALLSVSILKPADGLYYMTGFSIDFEGIAAGGNPPVSYAWDFGDATPIVVGQSVAHTYAALGDYTVTLTGTDAAANVDTDTIDIHIVPWQPTIINAKCRDITDGPTLPFFEHETEFGFEVWNPNHNAGNNIVDVSVNVAAEDYGDCDADNEKWDWFNLGDIESLNSFYIIHSNFCDEEALRDIKFEINVTIDPAMPPAPPDLWSFCATCPDADGSDCDVVAGVC